MYKTRGLPEDPQGVCIPGDGACLFSSVYLTFYYASKGKLLNPNSARFSKVVQRLREETVDYVIKHWDWPLGGVRGNIKGSESVSMEYIADPDCPEIVDKASYASHMACPSTFGGQTELQALSALLNVGILVHPKRDAENDPGIYFCNRAGTKNVEQRRNVGRRKVLHLLFDERLQHYEAIIEGQDAARCQ